MISLRKNRSVLNTKKNDFWFICKKKLDLLFMNKISKRLFFFFLEEEVH